jgi:hypothetical protein
VYLMRDQGVERGEWGILRFGEDGQESDVTVRKLCLGNGSSGRKRTGLRFERCGGGGMSWFVYTL